MEPMASPPPPASDPFSGMPAPSEPMGMAAPTMGMKIPEMTALREWEDKHQKELEEAQHKEDLERKAKKQKAEEEIKAFYAERATNIEKTKKTNRDEAVAAEKARQEATKPDANVWERVASLVDTNARAAE